MVQPQIFGAFQVLFDAPTGANGLHHGGQGRGQGSKDQVIGQFKRLVQAAAKDQPMATVDRAPLHQRQDGPIKEAIPFGALALTQALPVLFAQGLLCDAGHITEQASLLGLHTDDFGARNSQRVGVSLLLEPEAQVGAVAVDRVGHHPADGQARRLCSLDHALGQFGLGLKADGLRDMSGLPTWRIAAPLFWQIQFPVDEGMAQGRHVGEEDAHLTIFDPSRHPAILRLHARRVAAPLGKAADHSMTSTGKGDVDSYQSAFCDRIKKRMTEKRRGKVWQELRVQQAT